MIDYVIRVGDALSQLANVVFLMGQANESISGRAYREAFLDGGSALWRIAHDVIDSIFFWEDGHCKASYDADVSRAARLLQRQGS